MSRSSDRAPAIQFYPGDWKGDINLRACSLHARGLWIEMMCLMHGATPYGHLVVGEQPMDVPALARIVGDSVRKVQKSVEELKKNGVVSSSPTGVLFSRRMIRDEDLRRRRAEGGQLGGNPQLTARDKEMPAEPNESRKVNLEDNHEVNHAPNLTPNLPPTPSVSSSSSASVSRTDVGGWLAREAAAQPVERPADRSAPDPEPPTATGLAVALAVAANQAVTAVCGESPSPYLPTSGAAVALADRVLAEAIPPDFAVRAVFTTCQAFCETAKAQRDPQRRPGSLSYFGPAIARAWAQQQANTAAADTPTPPVLEVLRGGSPARSDPTEFFRRVAAGEA